MQTQPLEPITESPSKFFDGFNVRDDLKGLSPEEIKVIVEQNTFPADVAMMQIQGDFNFASVVRNANAFGFRRVFYCGQSRKWDKRGAVGTYHYTDVIHCPSIGDLVKHTKGQRWVALENNVDYQLESLYHFHWPERPLLIIGEEGQGLAKEVLDLCHHIVSIPQYGSVRSINAATAAGIAMNHYAMYWSV